MNKQTAFRVYWKDFYPKKSRRFHDGWFQKRQDARQWCRNHSWLSGLVIVHPDGTEEPYNTALSGPHDKQYGGDPVDGSA